MLNWIAAGISGLSARSRTARRGAATLAAAAVVALAVSACGGSGSSSSNANAGTSSNVAKQTSSGGGQVVSGPGGTVRIRSIDDLDTFDPAKTGAPNMAVQAIEFTYDRLVYLSPSGKIEPYLASSWKVTPNSVTFMLRKGPTCDDGTPVDANVV